MENQERKNDIKGDKKDKVLKEKNVKKTIRLK